MTARPHKHLALCLGKVKSGSDHPVSSPWLGCSWGLTLDIADSRIHNVSEGLTFMVPCSWFQPKEKTQIPPLVFSIEQKVVWPVTRSRWNSIFDLCLIPRKRPMGKTWQLVLRRPMLWNLIVCPQKNILVILEVFLLSKIVFLPKKAVYRIKQYWLGGHSSPKLQRSGVEVTAILETLTKYLSEMTP